ncbi:MAG: type VI secretion system accessory protein TagJ [Pigmentiphaga sp.]|uniref:type VI secretion system accessory protein TagJ n=1 Tax=Pigmentiphaga sp. TaxID=1977564 RepID=UPI0029A0DEC6|nr:type VI secretion system accessory protein TagJ [Pigmentiphaga sp.]MDX3905801.1 type VI secretion system accessory protein TagJ [Pigmentiphaga sp.]
MLRLEAGSGVSLAQAVETAQQAVRDRPEDADLRARLFQVLAVCGLWDKAHRQLAHCARLNPAAHSSVLLYDAAMRGEMEREQVLAGQQSLRLREGDAAWMGWLARALEADTAGHCEQADELRSRALDEASAASGALIIAEGKATRLHDFQWLADGDSRLGPVCEILVNGRYGWIAFADIAECRLSPPQGLTDLLWTPAELVLRSGRTQPCLIPVRYCPGAADGYARLDDAAKLSRRTEWHEVRPGHYVGTGQKMWVTDEGEYALLDIRAMQSASVDGAPHA